MGNKTNKRWMTLAPVLLVGLVVLVFDGTTITGQATGNETGGCGQVPEEDLSESEKAVRRARIRTAGPVTPVPFSGDINADGKVNSSDLQCYLRLTRPSKSFASKARCQRVSDSHADLNCDEQLNSADAMILREFLRGNPTPNKEISPLSAFKIDGFITQACKDKHWFFPANLDTWMMYFNSPGLILENEGFTGFTHKDFVMATIQSKDLALVLSDEEQTLMTKLKNDFKSEQPEYSGPGMAGSPLATSNPAVMGGVVNDIDYSAMAEQASDILHSVMFRGLDNLEFDLPIIRVIVRESLMHFLYASYRPIFFLRAIAIGNRCMPGDELCAAEAMSELLNSSLVRQQMKSQGYHMFNIDELGKFLAAQPSPLITAFHFGWVSSVEARFFESLGLNLNEAIDLDKIKDAVKNSMQGLDAGKSLSNVGSAPSSCVNMSKPDPSTSHGALVAASGVLGDCLGGSGGEPGEPGEPPGVVPGAGPDPDPTAMPQPLDPALQPVPPWANESDPCYGIDSSRLFGGDNSLAAGLAGACAKNPTACKKVAMAVLRGAFTGTVKHTVFGDGTAEGFGHALVGPGFGVVVAIGTAASFPVTFVSGVVFGSLYDYVREDKSGYHWVDGDGQEHHAPPTEEGLNMFKAAVEKAMEDGTLKDWKKPEPAKNDPNTGSNTSFEGEMGGTILELLPNPLELDELAKSCSTSIANSFLSCMFPPGGDGDEVGSTSQCESACMVANADLGECGANTFQMCNCADAPGDSGSQGGVSALNEAGENADCPHACSLVGGPLLPNQPEDLDCTGCNDLQKNTTNLVGLCGQGMIPPGLIKLCGAIDPAGQLGQPTQVETVPASRSPRNTARQGQQRRNTSTRAVPGSTRQTP